MNTADVHAPATEAPAVLDAPAACDLPTVYEPPAALGMPDGLTAADCADPLRDPRLGAPPEGVRGERPTPEHRRAARLSLVTALALGLVADLLFRGVPLGLNLGLWTACALGPVWALARRAGRPLTVGAGLLGALALAFAACVAWRDADALVALDLAALATAAAALARAVRHGTGWAVEHAEAGAYVAGAAAVAGDVLTAAGGLAVRDAAVGELRGAHRARSVVTVARGLFLAAPLLVVFLLLLTSADRAFERLVQRAFDVDLGALGGHLARTAGGAWGVAGFAASALFARDGVEPVEAGNADARRRRPRWFGRATGAEICVALGTVDALFLTFVLVQLGWLFGGRAVIGSGAGVTYAEYARRGFFELASVAGLALPLLLATRAGVVRAAARGDAGSGAVRAYRVTAGALIALVAVMLASAADRMRLYQAAYGVTELRLYVSAFMAWLLAVFAWAAVTLLRQRPAPFALGALLLGWTWVFALNAADPAAWVVRINSARAAAGRPLDAVYLAELGADAVPGLVAAVWPLLDGPEPRSREGWDGRCEVARAVAAAGRADAGGWRSWNAARARAARTARAAAEIHAALPRACASGLRPPTASGVSTGGA